jgi:hypothetical protein
MATQLLKCVLHCLQAEILLLIYMELEVRENFSEHNCDSALEIQYVRSP